MAAHGIGITATEIFSYFKSEVVSLFKKEAKQQRICYTRYSDDYNKSAAKFELLQAFWMPWLYKNHPHILLHIHILYVHITHTNTHATRRLLDSDGEHPSLAGSYLQAVVVYGTVTNSDPRALCTWVPKGLDDAHAALLREVAWHALQEWPCWPQPT